ncbi:hypothetical protein H6P81_005763 [Aristolochia fimbriata]|uniref:Uncharacterized protein n=1 Tax=Aristolochia fimbriata TaxID=158543 RepID=A0AAV7EWT3_ARIFI|nr:hypothetical protein H6P81_005763 [Aristolochia fimbriata]
MSSSSSSGPLPNSAVEDPQRNLLSKVRAHEVAIAELNGLSSGRAVYQRSGNIYFRTNIKTATASEQRQLDSVKAQLEKINPA